MRRHLHAGAAAHVLGAEVVDEAPRPHRPALPPREQPPDESDQRSAVTRARPVAP
jgi:hypothetical protein